MPTLRCNTKNWLGVLLMALMASGCSMTAKSTPTPRARTFITFKQAYAEAKRAALAWDVNAALVRVGAAHEVYGGTTGTTVVLLQDGTSAWWLFDAESPTRQTQIYVQDGQVVRVGIEEKGEMVCVGSSWEPLWVIVDESGCGEQTTLPTAAACVQAAVAKREIVCDKPIPLERLRVSAIPADELMDSDAIVSMARQQGFADWGLTGISIEGSSGTLTFESKAQQQQETRYVVVNGRTGKVESVTNPRTGGTPVPGKP